MKLGRVSSALAEFIVVAPTISAKASKGHRRDGRDAFAVSLKPSERNIMTTDSRGISGGSWGDVRFLTAGRYSRRRFTVAPAMTLTSIGVVDAPRFYMAIPSR